MSLNKRVLLAMSGGVDSSTAAIILKEQGYAVTGITMRLWTETDSTCGNLTEKTSRTGKTCCSSDDIRDAQRAASRLNIPHYVLNYKNLFHRKVVEPFIAEYQNGRTPNPCLLCNQEIKFEYLLRHAVAMGFDFVATGHYARISRESETGQLQLLKGNDLIKDQSYFLYGLSQNQLSRLLFPLGQYNKDRVRAIAEAHGLNNARKKDSQEICFIDADGYQSFLDRYNAAGKPGHFVSHDGRIIGMHQGISRYTVGQRKGLGQTFGQRLFVTNIDPESNQITLGSEQDLYADGLLADQIRLSSEQRIEKPVGITAKIRSQSRPAEAILLPQPDNMMRVDFQRPQRAVTPGQAVVFYHGDRVIGGGRISKAIRI